MTRRVAISSGHALHVRGARGNPVPPQLDEVDQARRVVDRVAEMLGCPKFHDNTSTSQSQNLNTITSWHNKQTRDLDVSVHFNAYDHSAHGTEVLYVTQQTIAKEVCDAIVLAGDFTNRGAKYRSDLAFLNNTNKPAILIETCFCDHTGDSNAFMAHFEPICRAIAEEIGAIELSEEQPPSEQPPEQPPAPHNPWEVPIEDRPTLSEGDNGADVVDLQRMLPRFEGARDGDFGPITDAAVRDYQRSRGLISDGLAGPETWDALYSRKPPLPPPPGAFTQAQQDHIMAIAADSWIARYAWKDRGVAPIGYTQGAALVFASSLRRLQAGHPAAVDMAKARTNSDKDVFNVYRSKFDNFAMSNEVSGPDTLQHLFAFLLGHGMRESSGRHCEGRDQSASNVQSDTAEAGLFQTSYNAHSASAPEFDNLMDEYSGDEAECHLHAFEDGVSCSSSEWSSYGSGAGRDFQDLCKSCPAFAFETAALTLRTLCNHYGPVIRFEVELKEEANDMFIDVRRYVESIDATGV